MTKVSELFDKAQHLQARERELLAMLLLESVKLGKDEPVVLDPDDEAELERRLEMIRSGQAKFHDLESVMDSLRATLSKQPMA